MEIVFTYSKNEWIDARRKYLFLSKTITKLQIVVTLCFALILGISFPFFKYIIIYIILCIILSLSVLLLFVLYILQPILLFNSTSKYHHSYKMQFTQENICFETQGISSVLSWNIYTAYLENDNYFFLLQDKRYYTLIPKRAFSKNDDIEKFKIILESHLTKV